MTRDPRIDDKIAAAPPFAQPILRHLRELVHTAIPDVEEAIKWGMPHFVYKGKNIAGMAPFTAHCAFVIHGDGRQGDAMGQFGKLASLADLPTDAELAAKLRAAQARVDAGGSAVKRAPKPRQEANPEMPVPDDLAAALADNAAAAAIFDGFSPFQRREYVDWITTAKRAETRAGRIDQAVQWMAEGKRRNWKYGG